MTQETAESTVEAPAEAPDYSCREPRLEDRVPFGFVAIGPFVWGRGTTVDEALANLRKSNSGRWPDRYLVYLVIGDAKPEIDQMGTIVYHRHPVGSFSVEVMRKEPRKKRR